LKIFSFNEKKRLLENKTRRLLYGIGMKEPETMGFENVDDQKKNKKHILFFSKKFTGELYGRHDHPARSFFSTSVYGSCCCCWVGK
jgi:hypothetical protein